MHNKRQLFAMGGLVGATILSGAALMAPGAVAEKTSTEQATATVTVTSSCLMTGTVNTEHVATVVNGHYQDNIGQTTIKTICNDANGYAIYAIGFSDNTYGNTVMVSDMGSSYNIATGIAENGNTSNWAMKIGSVAGTYAPTIDNGFNIYHVVPQTYTEVAHFNAKTDAPGNNSVGSSITTTYAAYISSYQIAGTYTGKVKYTLVHPANQAAPVIPYMQTVNQWANLEIPEAGDSIQAIDNRDGKQYWVTRMKDKSIWMTQNLDLDLTNIAEGSAVLNSNNTDLNKYGSGIYAAGSNGQGYSQVDNVIYWNPTATTLTSLSSTTWTNSNTLPYSYDPGERYYYTSGTSSGDTTYTTLANCMRYHTEDECLHYHAGNYYNWTAAVASDGSGNYTTGGKVAENSICPAGWRLPLGPTTETAYQDYTGSNYSEFSKLLYDYDVMSPLTYGGGSDNALYLESGYIKIRTDPLYFVRSGNVDGGSLNSAGSDGYYWSSTVGSDTYARGLGFGSTNVYPQYNDYRYYGFSVRCVARRAS